MKAFDKEIVSGSILRSVWKLAWPLVLLNLVNGTHGFVDHILIGHFVAAGNNAANAAIGVAWQVFLVIVVFIASLFHGMNVLIARYAGRQDRRSMSRVFYSTFLSSVYILLFIIGPTGYLLAPRLLAFVHVETEVQVHALPYLRILFTCGAPLFLMLLLTGAFQASGDPTTPLKLGVLTTLLNVGISTVLIAGIGPFPALGTTGAALGTVLAPLVSVSIGLYLLLSRKTILQPPARFTLVPDVQVLRLVSRIGLPTGIQGVLLNVGGVFLLKFIGLLQFSSAAQAAYAIGYAQLFSLVTWPSFGLRAAAGTLMGQNIGAGNPKRGKAAVMVAAGLGGGWAVAIGALFWLAPAGLLGLFNAVNEPVRGYGVSLLQYLSVSGVMLAVALALTGGLQGAGETRLPMVIAFVTQIVVLLGICEILFLLNRLTAGGIWMAILVCHGVRLALTLGVFRSEGWVHIRLELD